MRVKACTRMPVHCSVASGVALLARSCSCSSRSERSKPRKTQTPSKPQSRSSESENEPEKVDPNFFPGVVPVGKIFVAVPLGEQVAVAGTERIGMPVQNHGPAAAANGFQAGDRSNRAADIVAAIGVSHPAHLKEDACPAVRRGEMRHTYNLFVFRSNQPLPWRVKCYTNYTRK